MRILVTGASSQIGDFLIPRLIEAGHRMNAVSRVPHNLVPGVTWFKADLDCPEALTHAAKGCSALIHIAPVWMLPDHLSALSRAGVGRIVAFSSTSRFGKNASGNLAEQALVRRLVDAENALKDACERYGVCLTLLRPTLIYGCGRDQNISTISRFVQRFGFFPIAGAGEGLRQPVHADDLAQAARAVLASDITCGRAYNLGGGETLSYRSMVERIFESVGRKARIIKVPLQPLRILLRLSSLFPPFRYVTPDMADRMSRDLIYDFADAVRDFGYSPRMFQPKSSTVKKFFFILINAAVLSQLDRSSL